MQAGAKRKIFFTWPSAAEISPAESLLRIPGSCYSDDHWEEEYQPHFFGLFVIPSECEESLFMPRIGFCHSERSEESPPTRPASPIPIIAKRPFPR